MPGLDERLFALFGDAARAIGAPRFHVALLEALKALAPWNASEVMRYSRYAAPDFLYMDKLSPETVDLYLSGFYRFDPFFRWWREHRRGDVLTLRSASRPADLGGQYFTAFLPRTGMVDNLGILLPTLGQSAIALFVERETRRYTPADIARVRRALPLFQGLHDAHVARTILDLRHGGGTADGDRAVAILDREGREVFATAAWRDGLAAHPELGEATTAIRGLAAGGRLETNAGAIEAEALGAEFLVAPGGTLLALERGKPALSPLDFEATFGDFARGKLTPRETQIARLILTGYPTDAIAKSLGIGRGTVKNHRRRLYDRLDITTERELFSLFLEFLTKPRPS